MALDRDTGEIVLSNNQMRSGCVTLMLDSDHLIVSTICFLYCLDPCTGEILWHNPMTGYVTALRCRRPCAANAKRYYRTRRPCGKPQPPAVPPSSQGLREGGLCRRIAGSIISGGSGYARCRLNWKVVVTLRVTELDVYFAHLGCLLGGLSPSL